jgi:hypothetical protein
MRIQFIEGVKASLYKDDERWSEMDVFFEGEPISNMKLTTRTTLINSNKTSKVYDFNLNRYRGAKRERLIKEICKLTPNLLPEKLLLKIPYNDQNLKNNMTVLAHSMPENIIFMIQFSHNMDEWSHPFSVKVLNEYLGNNFCSQNYKFIEGKTHTCSIGFDILKNNNDLCLQDLIFNAQDEFINFYYQSIEELNEKLSEHVLCKIFDFPVEYANIYSQYLIWFGEFLRNIGIKADVHTEPRNEQTALIISPKDAPELLDEIEKLFNQYLQLPYVEVLPPQREMSIQEQHTFMAVKQQIQMLEMQVQAKDSLLLNNNATISSLNTTVARQANLIETQTEKLTLINALVDKDKWTQVPFTEGTFKCKNFGKKTMSIQFEPLAIYNKLVNKKDESNKDDE